jgi:hypothetical protein
MRIIVVDKYSPFLGEECPTCEHPFAPNDEIVICPECGQRHHAHCWQANGNQCAVSGCAGQGIVGEEEEDVGGDTAVPPPPPSPPPPPRSRRFRFRNRSQPTHTSCAQSCLLLSIAAAIILIAIACFGLWAIADYIMLEVLGWQYRNPDAGAAWLPHIALAVQSLNGIMG